MVTWVAFNSVIGSSCNAGNFIRVIIYLFVMFSNNRLNISYIRITFQCQFLSQWSFATMAGSETLDMSHMRRAGAWCRWGPWSLSSVPLIIRYYHNNHPGTGGRLAWDGTCWDTWNIIGQVEQLFIHSLAHPATSFKGRFSASSASHYELNKLSLVLSYFYCLWWSVVVGVFKYRSWHQTFPADMKKVMVWWSTLSCYVFSLITDHLPCGSRSAPPRHAARARERGREGDIITGHLQLHGLLRFIHIFVNKFRDTSKALEESNPVIFPLIYICK